MISTRIEKENLDFFNVKSYINQFYIIKYNYQYDI